MDLSAETDYGCWVDGKQRAAARTLPVVDPATEQIFAGIAVADRELVDEAVVGAVRCQDQWKRLPAARRSSLLRQLADRTADSQEALARLLVREVGKPLQAARAEVANCATLFRYFAEEALRLKGDLPLTNHTREHVLVMREPVGTVVAITPFNYPLSTLVCKLAPALAVGCAVVAKPDEHTSLGTIELARLATEVGFPDGVFQVVTGPGPETGRYLVEHPLPRLTAFTGSTRVGKEILAVNAGRVRKSLLELGGYCPAIVCEDADWKAVLPDMVWQAFKNSGQYCYRISRIYVAQPLFDAFRREFVAEAAKLRVGSPLDPDTNLGPLNNRQILERVQTQVEELTAHGGHLLLDGARQTLPSQGYFLGPTIVDGTRIAERHLQAEIFGPVAILAPFQQVAEAVERANATPYGLAAYFFSRNLGVALEHARDLEVGSLWINRIHQAYPEAPFGGLKHSGLGREKSHFGLEEFTELKSLYLSY